MAEGAGDFGRVLSTRTGFYGNKINHGLCNCSSMVC